MIQQLYKVRISKGFMRAVAATIWIKVCLREGERARWCPVIRSNHETCVRRGHNQVMDPEEHHYYYYNELQEHKSGHDKFVSVRAPCPCCRLHTVTRTTEKAEKERRNRSFLGGTKTSNQTFGRCGTAAPQGSDACPLSSPVQSALNQICAGSRKRMPG